MTPTQSLAAYRNYLLPEAVLPELPNYYRGKVRENYDLPNGTRLLIASDRISAFDKNLAVIPLKGQVLTQTARFWFEATADICPNHVLEYPDPNVLVCKRLNMMPVEIVVRDYLAGTTGTSILQMYKKGQRQMYGHNFQEGLRDNQKLPHTILTPTTKAGHGAHDAPLSAEDVVSQKLLTQRQWDEVSKVALALFARGRELAAAQGLILVDTKYELGFDEKGALTASPGCAAPLRGTEGDAQIVLADEIHTPDSSRYWLSSTYPARFAAGEPPDTLDKDFIRRWVAARCDPYSDPIPEIPDDVILQAAATYLSVYEQITGQDFALPDLSLPPLQRIRQNLQKYFGKAA